MTSTRTRTGTGTGTRTRTRTRPTPGRILAWALMTVALVATLFPFYWMVRTALTPRPISTPTPPARSPSTPR